MRLKDCCNQTEATVMCLRWFWGIYCLSKVFEPASGGPEKLSVRRLLFGDHWRRFWPGRDGFRASFTYDHSSGMFARGVPGL